MNTKGFLRKEDWKSQECLEFIIKYMIKTNWFKNCWNIRHDQTVEEKGGQVKDKLKKQVYSYLLIVYHF